MAANDAKADRSGDFDAYEQLRQLREQVETLMRERVNPIINEATDRAKDAAREVSDIARHQSDAMANCIREKPFTTVLIAAGIGYLLGRFTR